jgi:hypothetical protein
MAKNIDTDTYRIDRRKFLTRAAALGSGALLLRNVHAA